MKPITQQELTDYVEANIQVFHQKRLDSLEKLKLLDVVRRKNPYLFKAKNINTAPEFVKTILDAFLSSQEEGIFGGFLEELLFLSVQRCMVVENLQQKGLIWNLKEVTEDICINQVWTKLGK